MFNRLLTGFENMFLRVKYRSITPVTERSAGAYLPNISARKQRRFCCRQPDARIMRVFRILHWRSVVPDEVLRGLRVYNKRGNSRAVNQKGGKQAVKMT